MNQPSGMLLFLLPSDHASVVPDLLTWVKIKNYRVAWIWFMLGLVYHIRTETPCTVANFTRQVPLPCTKTEWEAQTEEDWRREYSKARNVPGATSLLTFGDLIDAHKCSLAERPNKVRELEAWNAGLDNLGMLLNVAVYMERD